MNLPAALMAQEILPLLVGLKGGISRYNLATLSNWASELDPHRYLKLTASPSIFSQAGIERKLKWEGIHNYHKIMSCHIKLPGRF